MSVGKLGVVWSSTAGQLSVAAPGVACALSATALPDAGVAVNHVAYSTSGHRLAVCVNATVGFRVYNTATWATVSAVSVGAAVTACAWSPDDQYFAVTFATSPYVRVYRTSDWTVVSGTPTLASSPVAIRWSPDGQYLAVGLGGTAPYLRVMRVSDWSFVTLPATSQTFAVDWSPNGQWLAAYGTSTPGLRIYKTADWSLVSGTPTTLFGTACSFAADSSSLLIAVNSGNRLARILTSTWAVATGTPALAATPSWLQHSADGQYVVMAFAVAPYVAIKSAGALADVPTTFTATAAVACVAISPTPVVKALGGHVTTEAGVDAVGYGVRLMGATGATVSTANTASDGTYVLLALSGVRYLRLVQDARAGSYRHLIDQPTPSLGDLPDTEHQLWSNAALGTLTGNVTTSAGVEADEVAIVRWRLKDLVTIVEPEPDGDWTVSVPPGDYGIAYFAAGCQPVIHGPYTVTAP